MDVAKVVMQNQWSLPCLQSGAAHLRRFLTLRCIFSEAQPGIVQHLQHPLQQQSFLVFSSYQALCLYSEIRKASAECIGDLSAGSQTPDPGIGVTWTGDGQLIVPPCYDVVRPTCGPR